MLSLAAAQAHSAAITPLNALLTVCARTLGGAIPVSVKQGLWRQEIKDIVSTPAIPIRVKMEECVCLGTRSSVYAARATVGPRVPSHNTHRVMLGFILLPPASLASAIWRELERIYAIAMEGVCVM